MTFREKYSIEKTWQGKITIVELYHLASQSKDKKWTIEDTAHYFRVSSGLVSENLKIARMIHSNPLILNCKSRQEALTKL